MNVLIDKFPTSIIIDGREYEFNTDYRYAFRIFVALESEELTDNEKAYFMLSHLYKVIPDNKEQAVIKAKKFLDCGENYANKEQGRRLFSYSKDARFIFAAFKQTHNIDLDTTDLHWWKFMALFMDLGETTFTNLISLRHRVFSGQATKEEKKAARELGDIFKLPEIKTIEEIELERRFYELTGQSNG